MKTIPTTAAEPVPFTPPSQDAERFEREQTRAIQLREQALKRDRGVLSDADVAAEEEGIANAKEQMAEQLATMRQRFPQPQVFLISIATATDRDRVNSRLIELGLNQASEEVIKATMIEELFNEQWGEHAVGTPENDTIAEDNANFLDGVWQRQDAHNAAIEAWREQEVERILDQHNGAPARNPDPLPPKIISIRENSRLQLVIDRMMNTNQRMRNLAAWNIDYTRRNHLIIVQMHVVGIVGFDIGVPVVRDPRSKALPEHVATALREAMDDVSYQELYLYIDRMYRLDGGEEKNSDSPPENSSDLSGSIERSGELVDSDGTSKISSSSQAPGAVFETITEPSSDTGSDAAPVLRVVSDTPTVAD